MAAGSVPGAELVDRRLLGLVFPYWTPVIAPVLAAAKARQVVEIGALRGDNTRQIIEHLGPDAVLHVIDPVPGFDPAEHEREFPGRYVFHQALSVDVLPELPAMDAALIDGDHNWYTVTHELRLLREASRAAKAPLPVLVLHDVGWPYGRRDLYYDPDTIPAEDRQPYRRAGMRPGVASLLPDGEGLSQGLCNAEEEGGPRNGVMTALDDFVAGHDRPLRVIVLAPYFGLAVVVEEDRVRSNPELAAALDRIQGPEGSQRLLALGERLRVGAMAHHHTVVRGHVDRHERLAARYLDGVAREVADGDAEVAGRLADLRRALDALAADPRPGPIVVVGAGLEAEAALAAAHVVAREDVRSIVVVDPAPTAEDAIRRCLDGLGLGEVELQVVATEPTGPDGGGSVAGAALLHRWPSTADGRRGTADGH